MIATALRGTDYPVRVINLERDTERWARIAAEFETQDVSIERYPGVSGAELSVPINFLITGDREGIREGTRGCALSHIGVWSAVAAGEAAHALVLEDDATPLGVLPRSFAALGIPDDYDLCYVNERMVPQSLRDGNDDRRFLPLADAMLAREPDQRGNGADGYFLNRDGARKLLDMIYQDRLLAHVDTQLLAYGQTRDQLVRLVENTGRYSNQLLINDRRRHADTLRSYVMIPPLVRQARGKSTRVLEDARRGRRGSQSGHGRV